MSTRNIRTGSYPREWEYVPQIENRYPDPPDNPQFCELPEAAQDRIDARFRFGIAATGASNSLAARLALAAGVSFARRCAAARAKREAAKAADRAVRAEVLDKARRRVRS